MRIYDISVTVSAVLPTWPGDPIVKLERVDRIENGADANVSRLDMGVHSGTHVDAPFHFSLDGDTVEQIDLKTLTGRVYVLHLPGEVDLITAQELEKAEIPPRTRRVLFKTRNSTYWDKYPGEFRRDYVALSTDGAQYLVERGVKLVGVDYLSVAPYQDSIPTHRILLDAGVIILEGLDLTEVSQGRYTLYCLPLKLALTEGAPARAILIGV